MTKTEKVEKAVKAAKEAQIRDDICARSTLVGLKTVFEKIPEEMVTAALSLAGGTGGASGSCGAYCCGLLAVGLYFNSPLEEELRDPAVKQRGVAKFAEYRERFMKEMDTVLCPELHKKVFGRSYTLYDPVEHEEFLSMPGHQEKCAEVVGVAARIAAEMILEAEKDGDQ